MYIGCARDASDIEKALLLATKIFNSPKDSSEELFKNKKILVSPYDTLYLKDVVILANDQNEICGSCILIDREFYKNNIRLKGTFLSSICISESHQGQGFSRILMDEAIKKCEERGSSFAVLIARKNVDYFYNKFSFWGLSEYSTVNFKIPDKPTSYSDYFISPATNKDLATVNELYDSTYAKLFGSCVRSIKYWKYVLWKAEIQNFNFLLFKSEGVAIGYVIYKNNDIYEIATTNNTSTLELLYTMRERYSINNVILHCSDQHPLIFELGELDFSCTRRQCYFGGHMVRILDADCLLNCLEGEVHHTALTLGISNHTEVNGDSEIKIRDKKLDVKILGSPYYYKNTCFLMMANSLSIYSDKNILYKPSSFNIPYFDQI